MKKVIALFLCIFYTFISFGGTIYVHECSGSRSMSIYEKASHSNCPLCTKSHHKHGENPENNSCSTDQCKDLEIQVDQLADKPVSYSSNYFQCISPAIITKYWISLKPYTTIVYSQQPIYASGPVYGNSSPPTFLLNCTFRL